MGIAMPKLENNETPKPVKTEFQNCGPTICVNWIFHRNTEPGSSSANIWYNHLCHAVAREPGIDFVTGERGFKTRNDLGQLYVSDQEFEYCRDINTQGNCEYYKAKTASAQLKHGLGGPK